MKLSEIGLQDRGKWLDKGYQLPQYDREKIIIATKKQPTWIHFGAGNIFRAFQANVVENLLNRGILDKGLIVAEGFDYEIIEKINRPHDNYSLLMTLKADGTVEKTVVGSIVESCILDSDNLEEFGRVQEIIKSPSLQMASFTITEKGYSLVDGTGEYLTAVVEDFKAGYRRPASYMGKIASLLYERFKAGKTPLAMVSMDNCSHNGDKLYEAIHTFAYQWGKQGLVPMEFMTYIEEQVTFPWTMIDKITPRPDMTVVDILEVDGVMGMKPIVTSKNTYVAPFVNAEECEYLVIEDAFPNGRPPLEQGGIWFTDRQTVDKMERMKVCTCLNPLHTALAVFGCLLGYEKISHEMKDEVLKKMVEVLGIQEGLPVVVHPGIFEPKVFLDAVLNKRIPNPFMPDTPQRIATDTSKKLAIRFGETIKAYANADNLDVNQLTMIPLVLAGWLRYLMAVDDNGNPFTLSSDPLLEDLCPMLADIKLTKSCKVEEHLRPILENESIFGVNLYEVGLSEVVCKYFEEMIEGVGAVKRTLRKYVLD